MTLEYRLMKGDILLGELFNQTVDMPWFDCKFVPTGEFEQVRALFDAGDIEELIRQNVRLKDADSGQIVRFVAGFELPMSLSIRGDKAWFSNI